MMAQDKNVLGSWVWMVRYVAVIALAAILALALGHMDLFEKTTVGGKLSASHMVQFLGFGAALAVLWALGRQMTIAVQKLGGQWLAVQHLILPVISLLVIALAYSVLLLLIKPFMGQTFSSVVNWIFIVSILACAGWLVMAVLNKSAPLTALLTGKADKAR